jgi:hypothetical protein
MNREGRSQPGQPSSGAADILDPGNAAGHAGGNAASTAADAPDADAPDADAPDADATGSDAPVTAAGPAMSDGMSAGDRHGADAAPRAAGPGAETARAEQAPAAPVRSLSGRLRGAARRPVTGHLALLLAYVVVGVAVTWPRTAYLSEHLLPRNLDVTSYVWGFYWVAHQITHLGNPFFTRSMAAPVGLQLGFDTLMPLPGWLMTPVTLLFGPSATFTVLTILAPGLLCYVMFRAARLWLGIPGSIAAGAFFGLSTMMTWQNWYHLNISLGALFLPMTLEATIRLRRRPSAGRGIILGLVLGASVLVNQESAVLAVLLAAVLLIPWLIIKLFRDRAAARSSILPWLLGALVAGVVAAPQLIAMAQQEIAGGATVPANELVQTYREYGVGLPALFSPSPRLAAFGLGQLTQTSRVANFGLAHTVSYTFHQPAEGMPTFGAVLSALALAGLALGWRRGRSWWLALLWLSAAALSLGPTLLIGSRLYLPLESVWHGVGLSDLMPYTWLVRIPGLSALREADRIALLGLVGAAILAGSAVDWLCRRRRTWPVLAVVVALGALEAGYAPPAGADQTMHTALPALDQPIAADRTRSIVVDVPFGLRGGGLGLYGLPIHPRALLIATADGHPRAISYSSWVPYPTRAGIDRHPFFHWLAAAQKGTKATPQEMVAARADLRRLNIGWLLEWQEVRPAVINYLYLTGFRYDYQQYGATVFRPEPSMRQPRAHATLSGGQRRG